MKQAFFMILLIGVLFAGPAAGGTENIEKALDQLERQARDFMRVSILLLCLLSLGLLAPAAWLYLKEPRGLAGKGKDERRLITILGLLGAAAGSTGLLMLAAYVMIPDIIEFLVGG